VCAICIGSLIFIRPLHGNADEGNLEGKHLRGNFSLEIYMGTVIITAIIAVLAAIVSWYEMRLVLGSPSRSPVYLEGGCVILCGISGINVTLCMPWWGSTIVGNIMSNDAILDERSNYDVDSRLTTTLMCAHCGLAVCMYILFNTRICVSCVFIFVHTISMFFLILGSDDTLESYKGAIYIIFFFIEVIAFCGRYMSEKHERRFWKKCRQASALLSLATDFVVDLDADDAIKPSVDFVETFGPGVRTLRDLCATEDEQRRSQVYVNQLHSSHLPQKIAISMRGVNGEQIECVLCGASEPDGSVRVGFQIVDRRVTLKHEDDMAADFQDHARRSLAIQKNENPARGRRRSRRKLVSDGCVNNDGARQTSGSGQQTNKQTSASSNSSSISGSSMPAIPEDDVASCKELATALVQSLDTPSALRAEWPTHWPTSIAEQCWVKVQDLFPEFDKPVVWTYGVPGRTFQEVGAHAPFMIATWHGEARDPSLAPFYFVLQNAKLLSASKPDAALAIVSALRRELPPQRIIAAQPSLSPQYRSALFRLIGDAADLYIWITITIMCSKSSHKAMSVWDMEGAIDACDGIGAFMQTDDHKGTIHIILRWALLLLLQDECEEALSLVTNCVQQYGCHEGIAEEKRVLKFNSLMLSSVVGDLMSNEEPASSGGSQVPLQPNVIDRYGSVVDHTALRNSAANKMHLHELCRKLAHVQLPQSTVVPPKAPPVPSRGQATNPPSEPQADTFSC